MNFETFPLDVNSEDLLALDTAVFEQLFPISPEVPPAVKQEPDLFPNYQHHPENCADDKNYINIPIIPALQPQQRLQYVQIQAALQPQQQPQPEEQLSVNVPSLIMAREFAGDAQFEVYINPHHGKKSPWVYSSSLNKIFITMNQVFPIDFKCKFPTDNSSGPYYVRATPVYSDTQYKNVLVTRCINHAHDDQTNVGCSANIRDHILRCQDRNTKYGGSKADHQHLYVRVPLNYPPPGCDSRQLQFQFMCKNSCTSEWGMNRRAIEVVFSLEDSNNQILGTRVLKVRICSCPKRDKEIAEKDYYNKNGTDQPQSTKKRKLEKKQNGSQELPDGKVYKLEINVPGAATARAVLKAVHGVLASELMLNTGDTAIYKKYLEEIQQKLNSALPHE